MRRFLILLGFLGWAEDAYAAAATMYVTPAGAGDKSGSDWDNAMGEAEFLADWRDNSEAGDTYYIYSGTYTPGANYSVTRNGTAASPIRLIGVSDQGDPPTEATGDDRPLFDTETYQFYPGGNYVLIKNWRCQGTGSNYSSSFFVTPGSVAVNVKSHNTSDTAGKIAIKQYGDSSRGFIIGCEAISDNGIGISFQTYGVAYGCYVHDCDQAGMQMETGSAAEAYFNIVDTCTTGMTLVTQHLNIVIGNTIYNCTTGISGAAAYTSVFLNNIIDSCTTGASWDSEVAANHWDYNNWKNNTDDTSNVIKGPHASALDPQFTDAENGDFSIGPNLAGTGFPGAFPGGLTTGYLDKGAVQRTEVTTGIGVFDE